jgi:putative salt-induced outer membrane protein YdiY
MFAATTAACALVLPATSTLRADEILFNNGDRLTGTVVSAEGGKLTVKTAVAGEVKVDLKDVKTFSSDQPVELQLSDGSTVKDRVAPATQPGTVRTAGSGAVQAQPVALSDVKKINPKPVQWTGSVLAGGMLTRGNTDTDNFNLSANAVRRAEDDRTTLGAGYLFGRQRPADGGTKETTTDNWFAQGKYDYFFAPKWYAYANARVEHDTIANLELRFTPGVGVGYQWVESSDFNFSTEGGITYVYEKYEDDAASDNHFAARFAYHVDKRVNERVTLFHNLEYLPSIEDLNDFNLNADAGMRVSLTERMFSELKAEWRRDQTPAPDRQKDDFRYILSLGWGF